MNDALLFLKGALIGALIAAPVGPVAALCVRRTLLGGPLRGWASGLGAAAADALYGLMAGAGLAAISKALAPYDRLLQAGTGVAVFLLGVNVLLTPADDGSKNADSRGILLDFFSAFFFTVINPLTFLAFAAVFAAAGVASDGGVAPGRALYWGVWAGAVAWWTAVVAGVSLFRAKIGPSLLKKVNLVLGSLLMLMALAMLGRVIAST